MNTIRITAAVATSIQAIRDAGKTPWILVIDNSFVAAYKDRTSARTAKAAENLPGSIAKADDLNFEVVEPVEEVKPYGYETHGFINCPHCGIHLDNGILQDGDEGVNGKPMKFEKHEFSCMACGKEFGPELKPATKPEAAAPKRKVEVTHLSTVERPCKKVWAIADEMHAANPNCKRREVLAECVNQGIAFYTARTQYQQWLGIQKEMAERVNQQAAKK